MSTEIQPELIPENIVKEEPEHKPKPKQIQSKSNMVWAKCKKCSESFIYNSSFTDIHVRCSCGEINKIN